ncbi:RNA polymerase II C-terminal domain phosphatase-like 4 [Melia azedarach]|uniref:RNA polymerase II C-terminal domain phosphatase-like 4 n=1 Tax=Melia azedarach TaxID=155640 RepID=A0ACC1XNE4_MELAZ|nr:RNA polymerase II C-terminal domain phosphatase-like 4 [Melia azedarach]
MTEHLCKRRRIRLSSSSELALVSGEHPSCPHSVVLNGMCIHCNKTVHETFGLAFDYILPGLRYGYMEVSRLKRRNSKALLRKKKLHLVLDLDHTLLHSRKVTNLSSEEQYLKKRVDSPENTSKGSFFTLEDMGFLVKLRPFVRNFLEVASTMFEMYVCTMGSREYALEVAKLLDPDSKYFSSRIIAREDFRQKERKNLNLVLGQESGVVILDDTESVWTDHSENLITASRYDYFKGTAHDGRSYSVDKIDESESNGVLANILRVLKTVHRLYFDSPENPSRRDVRNYLAKVRIGVLMGCTLLFSDGEDFPLIWSRAEEMGATCTTVFDSSVTHVVSLDVETEDCRLAERENKFLVHPQWINAAYFLWSRQHEDDYLPYLQ